MLKADGPREIEKLRRSILLPLNSQIYVLRDATGALLLVKMARMLSWYVCEIMYMYAHLAPSPIAVPYFKIMAKKNIVIRVYKRIMRKQSRREISGIIV